jgi:hypothetical protein
MTEAKDGKARRSLASVVDAEVYRVWTEMLGRIGRDSRTKRLSVLVAAMLQFAAFKAFDKGGIEAPPGSIAASLFNAHDWEDPNEVVGSLRDVVEQIFIDAGLPYVRTNRNGVNYNLIEPAIDQFVHWHAFGWEGWGLGR